MWYSNVPCLNKVIYAIGLSLIPPHSRTIACMQLSSTWYNHNIAYIGLLLTVWYKLYQKAACVVRPETLVWRSVCESKSIHTINLLSWGMQNHINFKNLIFILKKLSTYVRPGINFKLSRYENLYQWWSYRNYYLLFIWPDV